MVRALCAFWEALSVGVSDDDEIQTNDGDEIQTHEIEAHVASGCKEYVEGGTLNGWAGKMKKELLKEFIQSKNTAPYRWHAHQMPTVPSM